MTDGTDWVFLKSKQGRIDAVRTALIESGGIPFNLHDGLIHYLVEGRPMGHFLTAIVNNDLMEACRRADLQSARSIYAIATFLYNYAPSSSFGEKEHVEEWLKQHGSLGIYAVDDEKEASAN